jgi:hypothetical protein
VDLLIRDDALEIQKEAFQRGNLCRHSEQDPEQKTESAATGTTEPAAEASTSTEAEEPDAKRQKGDDETSAATGSEEGSKEPLQTRKDETTELPELDDGEGF